MENKIKSGRKKGFVVLFRSAAQDDRLSLEARGLFALMVSLPENWSYTVAGLAKKAGCGREKARRLLQELQTVGYLVREQSHDDGGKFSGAVYVLQDEAPLPENPSNGETKDQPLPEKPTTAEPSTAEPSTGIAPEKNKELKTPEEKEPPKAPQRGRRGSKYDLAEDAKPLLQAYVAGDQELHRMLGEFIKLRVELQAINSREAIKRLLNRLDKLSGGDRGIKLQLLDQSITSSWKSVFPLRGKEGQTAQAAPQQRPAETRRWHTEVRDGEEVVVYD